jgi:alpha/beta superfamily hydrolase
MSAWLHEPEYGKKVPAIIWLTGGFPPTGVGDFLTGARDHSNDQSASAFRERNFVTMYPAVRGIQGNPGKQESFFGEVDDVLAALRFLQAHDRVNTEEIYLGGHSTGGTLALLVAAATSDFRAVLSFGPASSPADYGAQKLTYDPTISIENDLRSPIKHLDRITSRTLVIEGGNSGSNRDSLLEMKAATKNPQIEFHLIEGGSHFTILEPLINYISLRLAISAKADLKATELQGCFDAALIYERESNDLHVLGRLRYQATPLDRKHDASHPLYSWDKASLDSALGKLEEAGWLCSSYEDTDSDGDTFYRASPRKAVHLADLVQVFAASAEIVAAIKGKDVYTETWTVDWER